MRIFDGFDEAFHDYTVGQQVLLSQPPEGVELNLWDGEGPGPDHEGDSQQQAWDEQYRRVQTALSLRGVYHHKHAFVRLEVVLVEQAALALRGRMTRNEVAAVRIVLEASLDLIRQYQPAPELARLLNPRWMNPGVMNWVRTVGSLIEAVDAPLIEINNRIGVPYFDHGMPEASEILGSELNRQYLAAVVSVRVAQIKNLRRRPPADDDDYA